MQQRIKTEKTKERKNIIKFGESKKNQQYMAIMKWRDFEVHHFIVIWGKMHKEFVKTSRLGAKGPSLVGEEIRKKVGK